MILKVAMTLNVKGTEDNKLELKVEEHVKHGKIVSIVIIIQQENHTVD